MKVEILYRSRPSSGSQLLKPTLTRRTNKEVGPRQDSARTAGPSGFTLIEMIGILAVLTILATVLLSTTTRQMDVAAGNLETTNLVNFATALQTSIVRNRYVPGSNDVIQVVANELGLDAKDVTYNARRNTRAFFFDPLLQIGTSTSGQPYQQTIGGAVWTANTTNAWTAYPPINPRVMIVSSLGPALPALGSSDFIPLWGLADGASPNGAAPAFNGWTGRPDDLKIQRVNLTSLFVHLILYDFASIDNGRYAIDRLATNVVPSTNYSMLTTNGIDAYYIKGTLLGLLKGNKSGGTLDSEQILTRDASFGYVQQIWRSSINLGEGIDPRTAMLGSALYAASAAFQASPYNTKALNGVTPPKVVSDMIPFFTNYVIWAANSFPLSGSIYTAVKNSQTTLLTEMNNLAGGSAYNNMVFVAGSCTNPPAVP
jgi:type II secretory pathway pseudopilin PulG